jgi:hypothetical protein
MRRPSAGAVGREQLPVVIGTDTEPLLSGDGVDDESVDTRGELAELSMATF